MSSRTPFFNFGAPVPQQVINVHYASPQTQPAPQQAGWVELYCDVCEGRIEPGEKTVEVFLGIAGRSERTGYLTTIPDPHYRPNPQDPAETTTVHRECLIDHVIGNLCTEQADDMFAEHVMEMATEMFEEWKQSHLQEGRLEERLSDPES